VLSLTRPSPYYPTASELRTATQCLAPWALGLPTIEDSSSYSEEGRRRHKMAEKIAMGNYTADDGWWDEQWAMAIQRKIDDDLAVIDRYDCEPAIWLVERGISYRPTMLGGEAEFIERKPGERLRGAYAGTADLAYVRNDGVLVVADWKLGARGEVNEWPASENPQLWFLALALATALRISASSASVVVARVELRHVFDNGDIEVDGYDITQGELDAWAEQLASMANRIQNGDGEMPRRSEACGRCKSRAACPAWRALQEHVLGLLTSDNPLPLSTPISSVEQALIVRDAKKVVSQLSETWDQRLIAWHERNPGGIPIGLGMREVMITTQRREVLDTPEALAAIAEVVGAGAIERRPHVTLESIRATARKGIEGKKGVTKAEAEEAAIVKLEAMGAIVPGAPSRRFEKVRDKA